MLNWFIILFAPITSWAVSFPIPTMLTECRLMASVNGDPAHYLLYGRDSWRGSAPLECETLEGPENVEFEIIFNSILEGIGADQASVVNLNLRLWTFLQPNELQIRAMVMDNRDQQILTWSHATDLSGFEVQVESRDALPGVQRSLSKGSLMVRAKRSSLAY